MTKINVENTLTELKKFSHNHYQNTKNFLLMTAKGNKITAGYTFDRYDVDIIWTVTTGRMIEKFYENGEYTYTKVHNSIKTVEEFKNFLENNY